MCGAAAFEPDRATPASARVSTWRAADTTARAHTHEAHDEIIIHMVVVATVRFQTPLSIIDLSRVKVVREQGGGKEDIEHTPGAMEPKLTGKRHDRNLVVWRAVVRTVAWERHDGEN